MRRKRHRVTLRRSAQRKRSIVADDLRFTTELWLPLAVILIEGSSLFIGIARQLFMVLFLLLFFFLTLPVA